MADVLLKDKTMKDSLYRLILKMILIAAILLLSMLWFCSFLSYNYSRDMEDIFLLDDLYDKLDETDRILEEYVCRGEEEQFALMMEKETEVCDYFDRLGGIGGTHLYQRNLSDVRNMSALYFEEIRRIAQDMEKISAKPELEMRILYEGHEKAEHVYLGILNEFQVLHRQLISSVQQKEAERNRLYHFCILGFFLILLLYLIYQTVEAGYFVAELTKPLYYVAEHVKNFNLQKIFGEKSYTEIETLKTAFNLMTDKIKEQMNEIRENAKMREKLAQQEMVNLRISNELKASELAALQMQINPHFLFNTLNMIAQTAFLENADQTIVLLDQTAKLLRYTLDASGREVTLRKEMEMLGSYVFLQEQRFGKRIQFIFTLDESFHDIRIPSLVLQPLVENSITHGIGMRTEDGKITISTKTDERRRSGMITITDNGAGITTERLDEIREDFRSGGMERKRVGLKNVYARLQLFYNGRAEMNIHSIWKQGTSVEIVLPLDEEKRSGSL